METVGARPRHARRCAEALGRLAQTDRGEAARLVRLEDCEAVPQKLWEPQDLEAPRRLLAKEREAVGKHLAEVSREASAVRCGSSTGASSGSRPASPRPSPPTPHGQCAQAALVAVMRKLVVRADALLRQDRLWHEQAPLPELAR